MSTHRRKWYVQFSQDWSCLFRPGKCNWVDFTFIALKLKYEKAGPQLELEIGLLGFCAWICRTLEHETRQSKQLVQALEELKKVEQA